MLIVFARDVAQLILEFGKPRVLEITKDIRVTFVDILGTVGKDSYSYLSLECNC